MSPTDSMFLLAETENRQMQVGGRDAVPGMGELTGLLDDELRLLEHAAGL